MLGIVLGGSAGWLIAKYKFYSESKSNDTALQVYEQRIKDLISDLEKSKSDFKIERDKVITLSNRVSGHEAEFKYMEKKLVEQKEEVNKIQEKFSVEVKNLANEILDEKTEFQGFFRIVKYRLKHRLFKGGWSGEFDREVFARGHSAAGSLSHSLVGRPLRGDRR